MAEFAEKFRTGMRDLGTASGVGLGAAYLIFLSVISTACVVALLTAHQFQHAVQSANLKGEPVALWQIIELRDSWKILQRGAADATAALQTAQQENATAQDEYQKATEVFRRAETESRSLENALTSKLAAAGISVDAIQGITEKIPYYLRPAAYRSLLKHPPPPSSGDAAVTISEIQNKEFEEILVKLEAGLKSVLEFDGNESILRHRADDALKTLASIKDEAAKANEEFKTLLGKFGGDQAKQQILGNFLSQLNALDIWWLDGFGTTLATMEPDLLTLLLVLAMGTLGGTLHLARLYLAGNNDSKTASTGYFLYRPFLGAITALVIFVVARTGIFVVAEPGNQNGGAPLSPFFISFVAIVSGLLAEQAISSIQGTGEKWFSGPLEEDTARFSLRVADEAAKQKKDKSVLQSSVDIDEAEFTALFSGKEKVSLPTQKVAAAWLGRPIRELFTDLPPPA